MSFSRSSAASPSLTGKEYGGEHRIPMQVIADHVRSLSFTMADGAMPSNEGRGYVLRRILRRAARYARQLDQHDPVIHQLVGTLGETMGHVFPEVMARQDHIARVIYSEEESFGKTLDRGLDIFARFAAKGQITGGDAFQLYDTYGFPLDLTELMAREQGLPMVEREEFDHALEAQRQRSRQVGPLVRVLVRVMVLVVGLVAGFGSGAGDGSGAGFGGGASFVGYDELEIGAQVIHAEGGEDDWVRLVLDPTPFYAEAGGQVGDRGRIEGKDFIVEVENVQKVHGVIVHIGRSSGR